MLFLTDVEGLYADFNDQSTLIGACDLAELDRLQAQGAISSGMLPKLHAVSKALRAGVEAVQIIDGRVPHAILMELFTDAGYGTKVTA